MEKDITIIIYLLTDNPFYKFNVSRMTDIKYKTRQ